MRLKVSFPNDAEHSDTVCCVAWTTAEEFFSCGDDHVIFKWNLVTNETHKVCTLPDDLFPIDLHIYSRALGAKKIGQDHILITSSDGRFHLLGKNGRIEKSVDAHKGAVLVGQWSPDGSGLLTGGEDGQVKVWSRSGMLRSTVAQGNIPVYSAAWSADSSQVLYAQGKALIIKPLAPNTKPNRWKAHDGLILKVAWEHVNGMIVSGGEDCKYKVWDNYGRIIFSSSLHEYPITALSWAPNGEYFAVGSYNTLRMCDKAGWSHSLDKPSTGSLYCIAWSSDSTQLAAACANRKLLVAHLIERTVEWGQYEAVTTTRKSIVLYNVLKTGTDKIEYQERVIHFALAYDHIVVVTSTQCYIYAIDNMNTPYVVDLRDGCVSNVLLTERHFLLLERSSLNLYTYEGRLVSSPRWPNLNPSSLNPSHISISPDTVAVRDQADERAVQLVDTSGSDISKPFQHSTSVLELGLSQGGTDKERLLGIVDKNRDLYIVLIVPRPNQPRKVDKIEPEMLVAGSIVQSFKWHSHLNMVAAMQDTSLTIYYYPYALFVDNKLVRKTTSAKESGEFGRNPSVVSFVNNLVGIRRSDGSLVYTPVSPYPSLLYQFMDSSLWIDAIHLCRMVKENLLWACFAAMSVNVNNLETAEMAYAALNQHDKVIYIQYIMTLPLASVQMAEMYLLGGNVQEAESVLLQNGLVFRAIWTNMNIHNWNRALELAIRYKTHIDTVMFYRRKYLEGFGKSETNEKFIQLKDEVPLDEEQIKSKVQFVFDTEKTMRTAPLKPNKPKAKTYVSNREKYSSKIIPQPEQFDTVENDETIEKNDIEETEEDEVDK